MRQLPYLLTAISITTLLLGSCIFPRSTHKENYRIHIVSHSSGATIATPFVLSGTSKGAIDNIIVSGGKLINYANIKNGKWEVRFSDKNISYGNITLLISADNKDGNRITNIYLVLNITNSKKSMKLSGNLTKNYFPSWKVFAFNNITRFNAQIDKTGKFQLLLPTELKKVSLIAYLDNNNNNYWDYNELKTEALNFEIKNDNIPNITISLPKSYKINGMVKGNIFHLPIGIATLNLKNYELSLSPPSTHTEFEYSLNVSANEGNELYIFYFIDENNDGFWNIGKNEDNENYFQISNIILLNNDIHLDIPLSAKLVEGSVSGDDASAFNKGIIEMSLGGEIFFHIVEKKYQTKFYTMKNPQSSTYSRLTLFQDNENLSNRIKVLYNESGGFLAAFDEGATTNSFNIVNKKLIVNGKISGDDMYLFKLIFDKDIKENISVNEVSYKNSLNTMFLSISAFKDENNDGKWNYPEFNMPAKIFIISNQTKIAYYFQLKRSIIHVKLEGDISKFKNPKIWYVISGNICASIKSNLTLTNYWNQYEENYLANIYAFDDVNNNNNFDYGIEPEISKNHIELTNYLKEGLIRLKIKKD